MSNDVARFSFSTKWGCIVADEHTTVEQIMKQGVPEETAKGLLAIARAGAQRLRDKEKNK
jgi:hypothetical protein